MRSTCERSLIESKKRGTSETSRPSSSQRRASGISAWSGSFANAKITCSASAAAAILASSPGEPSTGCRRSATMSEFGGSASMKPTGRRPYSGFSSSRWATATPTLPAPTISVGLPTRPRERAWRCTQASSTRTPPSSSTVMIQIRPICAPAAASPCTPTCQVSTAIDATEIAPTTGATSSSTATRTRRRYMPRAWSIAATSSGKARNDG